VNRRTFIKAAAAGVAGLTVASPASAAIAQGELLHNGIRLPRIWPPPLRSLSRTPTPPPYLLDPPALISIDVGRQLFVDDFLVETKTLGRTFHHATYYSGNPLLKPITAWEKHDSYADRTNTHPSPTAMPFSDGVFYDPRDRLYKMWYMGGYNETTCLATSSDGLEWTRPVFDVKPGTNIVLSGIYRDSTTIWLDHDERDPAQRFKMSMYYDKSLQLYASPDGIHWTHKRQSGPTGDRTTMFYDGFRRKWVYSIRDEDGARRRMRRYWETDDFFAGATWRIGEPPCWVGADNADPERPDYKVEPQLYNLDAVSYESLTLGLFTMWRGELGDREKPNDICVGFSRDGFHWSRPDRQPFIPVSEHVGDWNWANVQSAGGCCLVVGDTLRFYVSGRAGVPGTSIAGTCSTGLATLRRDGFASMDGPGMLVTRLLRFSGAHLFVNAEMGAGDLRVGVEDEHGRPLEGLAAADCVPIRGNGTALRVRWKERVTLAALSGRPVRLRFEMTGGRLFAFWVARTEAGASNGFVAAGGPGFTAGRDA
jgi:hypothetical protein